MVLTGINAIEFCLREEFIELYEKMHNQPIPSTRLIRLKINNMIKDNSTIQILDKKIPCKKISFKPIDEEAQKQINELEKEIINFDFLSHLYIIKELFIEYGENSNELLEYIKKYPDTKIIVNFYKDLLKRRNSHV